MMHNRKFAAEIAHNVSSLKRKEIVQRAAEVRALGTMGHLLACWLILCRTWWLAGALSTICSVRFELVTQVSFAGRRFHAFHY